MYNLPGKKAAVLCLYCNYKQDSEQTAQNMLLAMLKQLVERYPPPSDYIKALYFRCKYSNRDATFEEIMATLKEEMSRYELVFLLLDALDELAERKRIDLLEVLKSLPTPF
jgi:hypothetical protein